MIASRPSWILGSGTLSQRISLLPCHVRALMLSPIGVPLMQALNVPSLSLCRSWLRHIPVLLGKGCRWGDVGQRRLNLILPATHDVALAIHHGVKANFCDF